MLELLNISHQNILIHFYVGWTAPIQVVVTLIILLVQLGPSALAGFALFPLAAPLQERIMAHRLKTWKTTNKFTGQRAKLLAESLGEVRETQCQSELVVKRLIRCNACRQVFLIRRTILGS